MNATSLEKPLNAQQSGTTDLGPYLHEEGVIYRVWALGHRSVSVHIETNDRDKYVIELKKSKSPGFFKGIDPVGKAGDLYKISIDGAAPIPDFVSHYQPKGILGPSMIVDSKTFAWQAKNWKRPAWNGHIIYECHIGTFTAKGQFRSAIEKLDYLVSLGITAVEIMPVADWAGERNWGYDGTMLFAPAHAYGTPDDFRALIDACHLRGLAVILDVVFNHLGPEGNFSHQYSDHYFHMGKDNPWGQNFNLDGPNSKAVRALLCQNIRYWLEEFRIDGFRMDATHAVHDTSAVHFLAEVAEIVHKSGGFIIAEDDRNLRTILDPIEKQGWNFDAVWADDFHHSLRISQTGERKSYLTMFQGTCEEIAEILRKGWYYTGQYSPFHKKPRGTPADDFPPQNFVFYISNHDQVGNRLRGDRLHESIKPEAYRALSLFLCLTPYTPLLFMGQEWGASAPFHYFTDMPQELGRRIEEGRKKEFLSTGFATSPSDFDGLLNPQDEKTFLRSKLNWSEVETPKHKQILKLYQAGLKLRKSFFGNGNPLRGQWNVDSTEKGIAVHYQLLKKTFSVYLYLKQDSKESLSNRNILLRSNATEFGGNPASAELETIIIS